MKSLDLFNRSSKLPGRSNHLYSQEKEMSATQMLSVLTDFDLHTGLSKTKKPMQRFLSQMSGMYANDEAFEEILSQEDPLVYEFFDMGVPESEKEVAYGTSITYPGKVGDEYYMTKGHFHTVIDTAEVYYCLRGNGYMLMENPEEILESVKIRLKKVLRILEK